MALFIYYVIVMFGLGFVCGLENNISLAVIINICNIIIILLINSIGGKKQ